MLLVALDAMDVPLEIREQLRKYAAVYRIKVHALNFARPGNKTNFVR